MVGRARVDHVGVRAGRIDQDRQAVLVDADAFIVPADRCRVAVAVLDRAVVDVGCAIRFDPQDFAARVVGDPVVPAPPFDALRRVGHVAARQGKADRAVGCDSPGRKVQGKLAQCGEGVPVAGHQSLQFRVPANPADIVLRGRDVGRRDQSQGGPVEDGQGAECVAWIVVDRDNKPVIHHAQVAGVAQRRHAQQSFDTHWTLLVSRLSAGDRGLGCRWCRPRPPSSDALITIGGKGHIQVQRPGLPEPVSPATLPRLVGRPDRLAAIGRVPRLTGLSAGSLAALVNRHDRMSVQTCLSVASSAGVAPTGR